MDVKKLSFMGRILVYLVLSFMSFKAQCETSSSSSSMVKFLKGPHRFSHLNSTTFKFSYTCTTNCYVSCKLDNGIASDCQNGNVFFSGLSDGNHSFEVCTNGTQGLGCATYNWTIDTIPPTAYITALMPFTNSQNVTVNISFSEPCTGGGGFECSSLDDCNLLVYGPGQVIPSSFVILEPNLKYSILVDLSFEVDHGRVILVMDKNFCTDPAGNSFSRTTNSSFIVRFDRRNVFVNLRTRVPEKLLQFDSLTRTVQATNDYDRLKVYLYFSDPVQNSSVEILNSINTSQGILVPIDSGKFWDRRYGFSVTNLSDVAIVSLNIDSSSIVSIHGTPVSPISPVTFLYDSQRPKVSLSTTSGMRTKERNVSISIKFREPVFGFNSSAVLVSGGNLQSFHQISRSIYSGEIQAEDTIVSISVPENVTADVSGNMNLPSNVLQIRHYSVPVISYVLSAFVTASFLVTSFSSGLLTVSTASLLSAGAFSRPASLLTYDPARFLFRSACHIQIFALSGWLAVTLPVQYDEFVEGLQWSIPYFDLPWEKSTTTQMFTSGGSHPPTNPSSFMSKNNVLGNFHNVQPGEQKVSMAASVPGLPLTAMEYATFFEDQTFRPEAEYLMDHHSNGWMTFNRSMFWLAVIGGSLILLHVLLVLILKFRNKKPEKRSSRYGALVFPRFEIFLALLALPCISAASASLIRGGVTSGVIVGILVMSIVCFQLLAILLFLSVGITLGKLLQYKEVHQEGQIFHWYQELVRVTLGPGKRGQWTWNNENHSVYLTMFGPLFEDLRGPPKYMLTQIAGGNPAKQGDRIIASDDETEDAEAPFIQKLFGILRIYYTLLESVKRVTLGILAGTYLNSQSSRVPSIILLCITSFQLFFLVLKKPFIKKKVQLVEIISVSCQVGLFATCVIIVEKDLSYEQETKLGALMLVLFCIGLLAQMINEWYALYRQVTRLDADENSFLAGLKVAFIGILVIFLPKKWTKNMECEFPLKSRSGKEPGGVTGSSSDRSRSSSSIDRPWLKQLREMARASFSKDGRKGAPPPTDPSSSRTKWSGLWNRRGSSPASSPTDAKSKPSGLYKDLEAIFASK